MIQLLPCVVVQMCNFSQDDFHQNSTASDCFHLPSIHNLFPHNFLASDEQLVLLKVEEMTGPQLNMPSFYFIALSRKPRTFWYNHSYCGMPLPPSNSTLLSSAFCLSTMLSRFSIKLGSLFSFHSISSLMIWFTQWWSIGVSLNQLWYIHL